MPRFDGKGPEGKGPKTGRGLGNCEPTNEKKEVGSERPRRFLRLGRGRGFRGQNR